MSRSLVIIITASDTGSIKIDIHGQVGKEGIITLLDEAKKLVEQGIYGNL